MEQSLIIARTVWTATDHHPVKDCIIPDVAVAACEHHVMKMEAEVIKKLISKDKELFGSPKKIFSYGTAGFRDKFGYSFVFVY